MSLETGWYFESTDLPDKAGEDFISPEKETQESPQKHILKSEVPLEFSLWNREYRSLDDNNPEIDLNNSQQSRLNAMVKKIRENWWELMHIWEKLNQATDTLENNPEENQKLQEILVKYFEENKDEIEEKLWITNISDLSPVDATKLVSMLTMDKLDYNYSQQITPKTGEYYFKMLSPEQKKEFKIDLYTSSIVAAFAQFEDIFSQFFIKDNHFNISTMKELWSGFYNSIRDSLDSDTLRKISWQGLEEIREEARVFVYDIMKQSQNLTDDQITIAEQKALINKWDDPVKEVYVANSKLFNQQWLYDRVSISELLEWWKWVCRNYAVAQEKLFEALKWLQKIWNNKLQNSVLVSYSWNSEGSSFNTRLADSEAYTNDHSWNMLITIWADWKEYITQIDSTLSDVWGWKWDVMTLDKTFERLFNDLADNLNLIDLISVDKKLEQYVKTLEESWTNTERVNLLKSKLVDFYNTLWNKKRAW